MTDIEKAQFAIEMISELLAIHQKIKAISLVKRLFKSSIRDAKNLVGFIESIKKPC